MNHILISINNEYAEQARTLIFSILKHNHAYDICFHVFETGLLRIRKHELRCFVKSFGGEIIFHHIHNDSFDHAPKREGVSVETYFRLFAPELLPFQDKVLYLDADIVVNGDISELFRMDMGDCCLAGVEDQGTVKTDVYHKCEIGLKKESVYINGGVLMMNLKRMREKIRFENVLRFISERGDRLVYQDQDIINVLFENEILFLPRDFNASPLYESVWDFVKAFRDEILYRENLPSIIHYMGENCKPWGNGGYEYKYYRIYRKMCRDAGCTDLYRRVRKNGGFFRLRSLKNQYDNLKIME